MKSEKLQDAIGEIRDDYIEDAYDNHAVSRKKKYYMKWGMVAACVCFAVLMGLIVLNKNGSLEPSGNSNASIADNSETNTQTSVDVDSLLSSDSAGTDVGLMMREIPVGEYTAVYEMTDSVKSKTLKNSIGKKLKKANDAFYILGHEDLQYIIMEDNDKFSLWKFQCFESKKYPYKDVLELIYNIKDAEDIETVTVSPADMDNTDEGIKLQKEIGTSMITQRSDIEELYKILVSLECYGSDNWKLINYDGEDDELLEAVRQGRYLTLNLRNGCRADRLKYTGISGMFYEYSGIAYNRLKDSDNNKVKKILGIAG